MPPLPSLSFLLGGHFAGHWLTQEWKTYDFQIYASDCFLKEASDLGVARSLILAFEETSRERIRNLDQPQLDSEFEAILESLRPFLKIIIINNNNNINAIIKTSHNWVKYPNQSEKKNLIKIIANIKHGGGGGWT